MAGFAERVSNFALGLASLGLERGENIAIIGDNRPEWVISELAAQALGGASIGVYQGSVVEEVRYIVANSDARFIVVEDQEQVDKLLSSGMSYLKPSSASSIMIRAACAITKSLISSPFRMLRRLAGNSHVSGRISSRMRSPPGKAAMWPSFPRPPARPRGQSLRA